MEICLLNQSKLEKARGEIVGTHHKAFTNTLRTCSACDGDYEDPEGTARVDQAAESEDDVDRAKEQQDLRQEFPVERK